MNCEARFYTQIYHYIVFVKINSALCDYMYMYIVIILNKSCT